MRKWQEICGRLHLGCLWPPLFISTGELACLVFTLLVAPVTIWAQAETGQITGFVRDQTGATVPGAIVTVTNVDTGAKRVTESNGDGLYAVPNLIPAEYEVETVAAGFSTFRTRVNITIGAKVGLDVKLEVGPSKTVIEVSETAASVKVNTETQTITQTLNTEQMTELPSQNRSPYDFMVASGNVSEDDPSGRGAGVAINGLRSAGTNVMLDGVANNDEFFAAVGQPVPIDSVQEVGITTSNFTAEQGRASAGVVNVTTKSGTNQFHGTAYEFNRVSALASNGFFNNANNLPASIYTRNVFGYSLGGPIIKNKLFFFNNTEWTRVRSIANTTEYVIDPAYIATSARAAQQVYATWGKLVPGVQILGVFSRNQLVAQGTDPCAGSAAGGGCQSYNPNAPMLDLISYSVAQRAGGGTPQNTYNVVGRVDYNWTDKTAIYVRYALYSERDQQGSLANSPYVGFDTGATTEDNSVLVGITHTFSPRFVSQTKLDFNRFDGTQPNPPAGIVPAFSQSGLGNYGVAMPGYPYGFFGGPQNFGQLYEDLSFSKGKHEIRWGGSQTYLLDDRTSGAYQNSNNVLGKNIGNGFDNLAAGLEYIFEAAINPNGEYPCVNGVQTPACTINLPVGPPNFSRSNRYNETGLYIQDSWRVKPRLTLNLGIRWEYYGAQHNKNPNLDSNFYLPGSVGPTSPLFPQAVANGQVELAPKSPYGSLWAPSLTNFAPRLGFAWDVFGDSKTSFRGGYSIGYERNFGNVTFNVEFNPPNYAVVSLVAGSQGFTTIPLSTNNYGILAGASGSAALPPAELRSVQPNIPQAYAHLLSASLEHQFFRSMHLEVDYSGSIGENQYDIQSVNFPGAGNYYLNVPCTPGNCESTLNNQYGAINFRGAAGHSTYNSMNVRYDIQNIANSGLTLRANYTYSHTIDDLSDTFSSSYNQFNLGYTDFQDPSVDKGSSQFDNRHRIAVSAIYQIPLFRNRRRILKAVAGGWELAPVLTARTGAPFTIYDLTNDNFLTTRVVLDQPAPPQSRVYIGGDTYTVYNFSNINTGVWVNPKCGCSDFGPFPANMTGRGAFPTPGIWNLDLGMYKNFAITDRLRMQLRLEAYNSFNHANFSINIGNAYIFDGAGSTIQGSYNGNRNIQLGAKIVF